MIQIISYSEYDWNNKIKNAIVNKINSPKSFDEYDVNVIDLRSRDIWQTKGYNISNEINIYNDLKTIETIIENSTNCKVVILLPQNINYRYYYYQKKYEKSVELKGHLNQIKVALNDIRFIPLEIMQYENTTTKINGVSFGASFYFNNILDKDVLTESYKSKKATTIKYNEIIMTTLDINSEENLEVFLQKIGVLKEVNNIPEWIKQLDFFDDYEKKEIIVASEAIIEKENNKIKNAKLTLDKNNKYKSVLYTNGDKLVEVIFEMLQEMLNYDLSQFEDDKKEDFVIKKSNITFIGEIKGVTSNVKSEHISQLDVHLQGYLDNLKENSEESVKSLLIINHQRNTSLRDRQPVHETQIKLAIRNESLIIETSTLLRLYEKYLKQELNSMEIENMLINNKGLLIVD